VTTSLGYVPPWPAPASVGSFVTYRNGGYSQSSYRSLNLGTHVGDNPDSVARNRARLNRHLGIDQPCWLEQVHGNTVVTAGDNSLECQPPCADASISDRSGRVSVVLTADCLPLLLCDRFGRQVAAVHCGWRGLVKGIIDRSLTAFTSQPEDLLAYLGPAISALHYEVDETVRNALAATVPVDYSFSHPVGKKSGHYHVNLYAVARAQLTTLGVNNIYGGDRCTFTEADNFFSYRRDGTTGRMASLVWLK
jgi:polyphenol oxidase